MAAFPDDVGQGDCGASLQSELLRRVVLLATIYFIKFAIHLEKIIDSPEGLVRAGLEPLSGESKQVIIVFESHIPA